MKHYLLQALLLLFIFPSAAQCQNISRVSLLMPFCSKQIRENPNYKDAELGNLCREYYQGLLIALDSLETSKVNIRLSVFDTQNDSNVMVKIMQKPAFKESDLIIGPVRQGGNKTLSQFAHKNEVFHISPLMTFSKTKLDDPYWVSANPDLPSYALFLHKYITGNDPSANIVVIADKSTIGKSISGAFRQLAADKKNKIRVVDFAPNFTVAPYISSTLNNHIVVAVTKESSVTAALRSIKDTSAVFGLHTYGLTQWFDFKTLDYNMLQRCNTFIMSPYFIDYSRDDVKAFVLKYRERFSTEPTEASFKGYDQMLVFGNALEKNSKKLMNNLKDRSIRQLGTTYNFTRQKEGCYQTNYLNILKLDHYTLKPVN